LLRTTAPTHDDCYGIRWDCTTLVLNNNGGARRLVRMTLLIHNVCRACWLPRRNNAVYEDCWGQNYCRTRQVTRKNIAMKKGCSTWRSACTTIIAHDDRGTWKSLRAVPTLCLYQLSSPSYQVGLVEGLRLCALQQLSDYEIVMSESCLTLNSAETRWGGVPIGPRERNSARSYKRAATDGTGLLFSFHV